MKYKLNKIVYNENAEEEYSNFSNANILNFIISELVEHNDKIWNYRDNIVLVERDNKLYYWSQNNNNLNIITEQYFLTEILGYGIYKDINIFSQNNDEVASIIYNLVISLLDNLVTELLIDNKEINLYGIGGEFYVYFKILKYKYFKLSENKLIYNGFSNNEEILKAAQKNNSCTTYNLINYNTYDFNMVYNGITIINLSKINKNIINNLKTKYVIAITCKDKTIFNNYTALALQKIFNLNNVKITVFKIN
tara:strand:- start:7838 stop:8590 length:753 start_codon:yes stop_codon:yes gene_type:complete